MVYFEVFRIEKSLISTALRKIHEIAVQSSGVHCPSLMMIHYPKLRNMTHALSLSVSIAFKGTNFIFLFG